MKEYQPSAKELAAMEKAHEKAVLLWATLKEVNELRIPIMSRDRGIGMKEQSRLAQELFKKLGVKGLRVRMSRGANCFGVDVHTPEMKHNPPLPGTWKHDNDNCDGCKYRRYVRDKLCEILARAFPQHDNRSDYMSDYFDNPWFIY